MTSPTMPRRVVQQIRPEGQPNALAYSPQRDLAYLFPAAAREAFESLDRQNWMGYYASLLEKHGITEEMLGEGVRRFMEAFNFFVGDPSVQSFDDALERTEFFAVPPLVRIMIFERLGEVVTVGFFIAVRDTTWRGQVSPQAHELGGFVAAAKSFVRRLNGNPSPVHDKTLANEEALRAVDTLKFELEQAKTALGRQTELTAEGQQFATKLHRELRTLQDSYNAEVRRWTPHWLRRALSWRPW